jgi:Family of unknown function (DUF6502)
MGKFHMSSVLWYYFFMNTKLNSNTVIFNALDRAIRPLVRLMLARGITYVQLVEWLKRIFVEVADDEFTLPNKAMNDSRISVITGVHRKDVKRLREEIEAKTVLVEPSNVNLGSQLVSAWLNTPSYLNGSYPKPIARLKKLGQEISFEYLAESITKDVRSRALLDELLRLGVVEISEDDEVSLITTAFIPAKGEDEKAFYLGLGVGDHAAAAVNNVLNHQPACFDRVVHYNHFSAASIAEIESSAREQGNQLLQSINTQAETIEVASGKARQDGKRFTLGVYFYAEDDCQDEN